MEPQMIGTVISKRKIDASRSTIAVLASNIALRPCFVRKMSLSFFGAAHGMRCKAFRASQGLRFWKGSVAIISVAQQCSG